MRCTPEVGCEAASFYFGVILLIFWLFPLRSAYAQGGEADVGRDSY